MKQYLSFRDTVRYWGLTVEGLETTPKQHNQQGEAETHQNSRESFQNSRENSEKSRESFGDHRTPLYPTVSQHSLCNHHGFGSEAIHGNFVYCHPDSG
jgi:hypothetical protein